MPPLNALQRISLRSGWVRAQSLAERAVMVTRNVGCGWKRARPEPAARRRMVFGCMCLRELYRYRQDEEALVKVCILSMKPGNMQTISGGRLSSPGLQSDCDGDGDALDMVVRSRRR